MSRFLAALLSLAFAAVAQAAEADSARQLTELQLQVQTMDARIKKIETLLQNHAAFDLLKEVETMKAEMSRLRGQAETQEHRLESLGKRQTDLYTDLDKRLDDLGKQAKATASPPPPATPAQPAAPALPAAASTAAAPVTATSQPPAQTADPLAESKMYEQALNHFKAQNYAAAIAGFRDFLKAYTGSSLAPNAQYWIGYAYYALKDYKSALSQQQKLVSTYPQSAKVPDALLNIANCHQELDNEAEAKKVLESIVAKHPGTNAAKIAARRLAAGKQL